MWRGSTKQQCQHHQGPHPHHVDPQQDHLARLHFPPPPDYPPPYPSTSKMAAEQPSTSKQHHPNWNDYSYAYYVPGPPTSHRNVPQKFREGSYRARHTYLTRYGTEENIYEEITEVARARLQHQSSIVSLNQSLVEEEVRRVQHGHRRVLGELNLSVEAMLMPCSSREGSDDTDREGDDQLADLLTIGPTDDLLSPVPMVDLDSGFSGSSSGASYRSAAGSLRRGLMERPKSSNSDGGGVNKGFWGKKAWKKLTHFPSNISLNKTKDEPRLRSSGTWEDTACDAHRLTPTASPLRAPNLTQRLSSEESWCGSASDRELSSDDEEDESDRSSTRSSSQLQLRNTLNKARTLCDKLRNNANRLSGGDGAADTANQSRLSRWFSIRRGSAHHYDVENMATAPPHKMAQVPEMEEEVVAASAGRRHVPPTLPPPPPELTPQQIKRRMIVAAIVHSENNYVATLQRLVNDYKKPLEESSPAVLSSSKISTLFHRLPEILQCHTLFRIALAESVRNWDRDEKIGDVFVASFSKAIVLDIYSGFINNFSAAMDLAKMEAKRKSALADFLKVKQISSHDRLSFFGLMVKPVQRFPQFILFLQDLLKHTPQGHHDRMSLQLALTQLESLAEMLNERKREAEQYQAFKEMLRHISGKFTARPLSDCNRYLLREDDVMQLEFNQSGMITKAKNRRLLLLNDLIVCVSVAPKSNDDFGNNAAHSRLSLKWTHPVSDVEIQDTSTSPTLSRVLTANLSKGGSVKSNNSFDSSSQPPQQDASNNLCTEMSNLMHDYEIMSRISDLATNLKGSYKEISVETTRKCLQQIQTSIQQKDEEMAWVDSCCLQIVVKTKGKEETYTFKADNPSVKKEWITELRLAQLALDPNNSPAWDVPEQEQRPSTKMPLFVKSQCVYKSQHQTEVRCGCYYTVTTTRPSTRRRQRTQNYLWVCTTDGASSHIAVLSQQPQHAGALKDVTSFSLVETQVIAMEYVKGSPGPGPAAAADSVWMGTDSHRLLLYSAGEPERQEELSRVTVSDCVTQIKCHCDNVFVALANGTVNVYRRTVDGCWTLNEPQVLQLGNETVSSLLPINNSIYAACGKKVWVLNAFSGEVQKSFSIQHEHVGNVNLMAHSGIGLWISLKHSSTICLYHTETFKHLQDINIASNVMRVTSPGSNRDCVNNNRSQVNVTALLACKGLLWVGTNVGITLTIPLPRLEGVPIISGRVNISYHAHFGPISFLLALQPKTVSQSKGRDEEANTESKAESTPTKKFVTSSPVVLRRRKSKEADLSRMSKTLPRGFGNAGSIFSTSSTSSSDTCDVYGLYGELMYIKDYEGEENCLTDPIYESLRRSDPELALPNKVSTLDRRLKMKVSRPRSLDLSNWSVDSRSSSLCTSSGSEESMALRHGLGRSVSRNNSNVSTGRQCDSVVMTTASASTDKDVKSAGNGKTLQKNCTIDNGRRTVITLMGGRGYVNFRQPCCAADKAKNSYAIKESNRNDAHVVIWELKL